VAVFGGVDLRNIALTVLGYTATSIATMDLGWIKHCQLILQNKISNNLELEELDK